MKLAVAEARSQGKTLSHFGREANLFDELADLFLHPTGKPAAESEDTIFIPTAKQNPGGKKQVNSRLGRRSLRNPIC